VINSPVAIWRCRSAISAWMGLSAELRLSESLEKFCVAVVATDDGRFAYRVFLVCSEPRTLLIDSARYSTPHDAAQAGYEAVASMSETPVRRPYAPSTPRRHTAPLQTSGYTEHRAGTPVPAEQTARVRIWDRRHGDN
jgi:hypothetical protein